MIAWGNCSHGVGFSSLAKKMVGVAYQAGEAGAPPIITAREAKKKPKEAKKKAAEFVD
jgi:hypothetical protein